MGSCAGLQGKKGRSASKTRQDAGDEFSWTVSLPVVSVCYYQNHHLPKAGAVLEAFCLSSWVLGLYHRIVLVLFC